MSHMNDTVGAIIAQYKSGNLSQVAYILEISKAVGLSGKTSFKTAMDYSLHLLN